jgi:hypothetical protein
MKCESIIEFPLLPPNLKELRILNYDQVHFIGSDGISLEGTGFHGKIPSSLNTINLNKFKNPVRKIQINLMMGNSKKNLKEEIVWNKS